MTLMLYSSTYKNVCIRCGKERIVIKEWEVTTETGSKIKKSETVCPDPSCQAEVLKAIEGKQKERERKEMARLARMKTVADRYSNQN